MIGEDATAIYVPQQIWTSALSAHVYHTVLVAQVILLEKLCFQSFRVRSAVSCCDVRLIQKSNENDGVSALTVELVVRR